MAAAADGKLRTARCGRHAADGRLRTARCKIAKGMAARQAQPAVACRKSLAVKHRAGESLAVKHWSGESLAT